jgi:hypothetical protein
VKVLKLLGCFDGPGLHGRKYSNRR